MTGRSLMSRVAFGLLLAFVVGWYWMPSTSALSSAPHNFFFYLLVMPGLWAFFILRPKTSLNPSSLVSASGVFMVYLAMSSLWAMGPVERDLGIVGLHLLATVTFTLGVIRLFDRSRLGLFRRVIVTAATSITVVSILALLLGRIYVPGRLYSAIHFEHPNLFAQLLGFAAVAAMGSALRTHVRSSRIVWSICVLLLGSGILLTRSRTVIIAAVVASLISIAVYRGRRALMVSFIVTAIVIGVLLTRGQSMVAFVQRRDAGRIFIWKTLLERIENRPLLGAGVNAPDNVTFPKGSGDFPNGFTLQHPHSAFVGTLYYGGLVGLGLLILIIVLAIRTGRRNARVDGEWDPLILLLFGIICLIPDGHRLISEPHLSSWLLFWLPIGLIAAGPTPVPDELTVENGEATRNRRVRTPLMGVAILLLMLAAIMLRMPHLGEAIDEPHSWRQCDTAQYIHAFSKDGIDLLHPSVCWMGDHRTLILEFPLYEAVSAAGYRIFGPRHLIARWVTLFFFVGSTLFLFLFVRSITDRETARLATVISMIVPLSLFYSRAIHIDYSALFFAHAMAWLWTEAIKRNSGIRLWMGSVPAALALVIKAPYVLPFVPVLVWMTITRRRWKLVLRHSPGLLLPALAFAGWQWHAMVVNGAAPDWSFIPTYRRFTNNAHWYFGGLSMRLNSAHWLLIGHRVIFEITGWIGLTLALGGLGLRATERRWTVLWWLAGAGIGVMVFFNLNVMHNYYQLALVGPISVVIALGILRITDRMKAGPILQYFLPLVLILAIGAESVRWSERHYYTVLEPLRTAGLAIGAIVPKGELVIVSFGGLDPRSPHLLYRARRYGWSIPERDLKPALVERLRAEGASWLAIVASEPPSGPLAQNLRGFPVRVTKLPDTVTRLFVYHLAERHPPLFEAGFEPGDLQEWAPL